jgi:arylformamidase
MIIHDISLTVTPQTITGAGKERRFSARQVSEIGPGGMGVNISVLTVGAHTGTHLEAPSHFVPGGLPVDALDMSALVGPAEVVRIYGSSPITAAEMERVNLPARTERVLFQTDNTRFKRLHDGVFHKDYTGLAPSAAEWLVRRGVRLVGIDYLSIGPYGPVNTETHKILLGAGIVVVESLDLDKIVPGVYTLMALPPKFSGLEASPCRCLLIEGKLS